MNKQQMSQLKKQLQEELEDVKSRLHQEEEVESTELSHYDNHPGDTATELTDQNTEMALEQHKEEEVQHIEAALEAMENGTYGKCVVCHRDIPFERLEALPSALTCIEHASNDVSWRDRPSEEAILNANTDNPVKGNNEVVDTENSFEEVEEFGSSDSPSDQA
ncbi:TraR/DksA C4-type zinc finger protein [Paenisporosarcina cavernae]|uniref:Molecular chaperone DnaK n=1 Tax=Paenisporosarcina cavernae TaxID=2320858 RepID=A0A385YV88_9BACL|nr:TraR/DksA C4-type zinc finger protein [Paenisporosarcina cavernae]AYC30464.1 molecular chaperone DnaK [Paenisporosarcina cavernae]